MLDPERFASHRKPARLEELLRYFEGLLGPLEQQEAAGAKLGDQPHLYIVGCARSGSTLVYQYLAESGLFTYPTNFMSRFYYAPYVGARLQEMMVEADFGGELFPAALEQGFQSRLGKTRGALAPHEFWYFWRRFFTFGDVQRLTSQELAQVDGKGFLHELRAMQSVKQLPLLLKGMILNWHIPFLASLYPRSYFLFVRRDAQANALSLVDARREFFGDVNQWYSFKPPGNERVTSMDALHQTAWQVLETNAAVTEGLGRIPPERSFVLDYEAFCDSPRLVIDEICERWGMSASLEVSRLPESFNISRGRDAGDVNWANVLERVKSMSGGTLRE
jgi:hypothetical protein